MRLSCKACNILLLPQFNLPPSFFYRSTYTLYLPPINFHSLSSTVQPTPSYLTVQLPLSSFQSSTYTLFIPHSTSTLFLLSTVQPTPSSLTVQLPPSSFKVQPTHSVFVVQLPLSSFHSSTYTLFLPHSTSTLFLLQFNLHPLP